MNVMTEVHPFLDGKAKRMLIDGKWLEAASGKTFETRNPATGEVLANVAEGDAEDIDRAVAAARAAFNGSWSKFKPAERQACFCVSLIWWNATSRNLPRSTRSTWARRSAVHAGAGSARWACCGSMPVWRLRCMARRSILAARRIRVVHAERTGRRGRCDHPVERPAVGLDLEDRASARDRLHRRLEAGRGGAADAAASGRALPGSGCTTGSGERRAMARQRGPHSPRMPM
jgi:Aldehyde dehydrogenase family